MITRNIHILFTLCFTSAVKLIQMENIETDSRRFPDGFTFGASSSAYQNEGAWNVSGKGVSIWDYAVHNYSYSVIGFTNGDNATKSYELYKRDVEMLKELGVTHYKFSISWPRILPSGLIDEINQSGIDYYNNLINELLANNIQPFVTMYHWDLPQKLEEQHGWLNSDIVDWFGEYARVLYNNFGDRVKYWITINEPQLFCTEGYKGSMAFPPRVRMMGIGDYMCIRNALLANARAWHIYDEQFRATQNGEVGIAFNFNWGMPSSDSADDAAAITDFRAFMIGHYMNPIFSAEGNYPQTMIIRVAQRSAEQHFLESRLEPFTQDQVDYMRGTADFLGLNHYTSYYIYRNSSIVNQRPSIADDSYYNTYQDEDWPNTTFSSIREYAPGLRELLVYLKDTYNNRKVYITDNGMTTHRGAADDDRVRYLRNYLRAVLDAIDDGVNVQGYTVRSLMDSFEWRYGYTLQSGLYHVNMNSANRTRSPRKSAVVYENIIQTRTIDYTFDPEVDEVNDDPDKDSGSSLKPSVIIVIIVACLLTMFNIG